MIDTPHTLAHDLAGEILADDPPRHVREVVIALGALAGVRPAFDGSCPGRPWPVVFVEWRGQIRAAVRIIPVGPPANSAMHAARWDALRALVTYAETIDPETP